ncbi:MAG: efflux RND transporter permease subunit [Armatimonadetes bacterium]|nr:efflux RND transporter permease subunit [Armatimonadota bacterium]
MNWNISAWSIKQPIPSILLFLILTLMGVLSFMSLGVDENPNIDVPMVSVNVTQTGAAPSELETQVTKKIEDAVAGIGNIKHISSVVAEGATTISINFELGTNIDRAVNDVRDSVARIRQQLPGQINDPIIQRIDFAGGPFATYTVEGKNLSIAELSWLIDDDVQRSLLSIPGVGQVNRSGGVDREIRVNLDPTRLQALGITADMVNSQIRALNINLPGGRGELGQSEQSIRTLGSAHTVDDLRAMRITLPNGGWARLDTLGTVVDDAAEPRQIALLNGKPAVSFSVVRSTGSNLVEVEAAVDKKLAELRKTLPPGVQITKVRTNAKYVMESYHASMEHLLLGAALAVFVIWLFLKDWHAAVISALAMPLSVIPTFWVMKWAGFTLNNMSLLGLALVIGILVDDAIVEIENIVRHIHMGKSPYNAALEAADEIGLAVVATTLTIIVVFVPVAFMGGIPGQFFKQFGLTVSVAVFFSLLVARLITPMMAAYWMKAPPTEAGKSWLVRSYDRMLVWAMSNRLATLCIAVSFFFYSLWLFSTIPTSLVPATDRSETVLTVELPPGSSLNETRSVVERLTKILLARKEVTLAFASIGTATGGRGPRSGPAAGAVNKATIYIVLVPPGERALTQAKFEADVRKELASVPGARLSFGGAQGLSGKLRIMLSSDDSEELHKQADQLLTQMRALPILYDVTPGSALQRPELHVIPNQEAAAEQGVSIQSIARTALIATLGDVDTNLAKFDLKDRQINIRVQLDPKYSDDLEAIRHLRVMGSNGRLVQLASVAEVVVGEGPSQIDRYDRAQQISIEATLRPGISLGDAVIAVHDLPAFKGLPPNVKERPTGDIEIQKDVFGGFAWAISAAVIFIYAVLVLLFGGFLQPLTIMMALPLSIGGALMGLIVTRQSLGLYALIGIVMLMGLATKNSILLVEYCLMMMHRGMPRSEAVMSSGEARMRPILMTTVAMIAGMTPIAMGIGAGSEVRMTMAIAVIGGLITSTFLTLLVVPVVFTLVDDFSNWLQQRFAHRGQQQIARPVVVDHAH